MYTCKLEYRFRASKVPAYLTPNQIAPANATSKEKHPARSIPVPVLKMKPTTSLLLLSAVSVSLSTTLAAPIPIEPEAVMSFPRQIQSERMQNDEHRRRNVPRQFEELKLLNTVLPGNGIPESVERLTGELAKQKAEGL
ncbi:hypothetical protein BJX70DRAFT_365159 [Aspergillus crustosus]